MHICDLMNKNNILTFETVYPLINKSVYFKVCQITFTSILHNDVNSEQGSSDTPGRVL